ncbi:hypothetical protein AKJ52_00950 [candidate division MSBL1 archaeon SCGC-AAA382C18]|uniref:Uncharacterized protein n=1 Tax=candidate division MSBL1 archaeon SCGC-AAA382C18 TaxID=1698281 RepID=A0A133VKZ7_9EURY|nr:hypothetical protein AKJ52_00950 [candidate division MSBL1 archaeon SCGC-AAA382C18]
MSTGTGANNMDPLLKIGEMIRGLFGGRGEEKKEKKEKAKRGPEFTREERAGTILSEKMGIPKDYEKYAQLKRLLEDSLSENSNAEALYQWSELLSSVIGEQMNRKLEEKEEELKAKQQENSRVSLDRAMSKAVKSGLLALSDETAIEILERLGEDPSSLSELKGVMELNEGARWRFEWLRSLGLVKPVLGKGENAIHELTKRGEKMLSRAENSPGSQKSLGKQRHRLAKMAAGKDTTADELLNVLDGSWLENHRSKLEKIRKKYKNPLVEISKSFWLEREGEDPHLKHAGIDIADHEASGALLCLQLMNIHTKERAKKGPENAWHSLLKGSPATA